MYGGLVTKQELSSELNEKLDKLNLLSEDMLVINQNISTHLTESATQTPKAGSTANAILLDFTISQGKRGSFIASANNTGNVTINGKPFQKQNGSQIPAGGIKTGKVYDFYADESNGGRFFLLAKASGDAVAGDVLAGKRFSNDDDTDILGAMVDRGAIDVTITNQNGTYTVLEGKHNGNGKVRAVFANLIASNIRSGINVGGIVGSLVPGVRAADGSITSIPTSGYTVTGLAFRPSKVIVVCKIGEITYGAARLVAYGFEFGFGAQLSVHSISSITSNGFVIGTSSGGTRTDVLWFAYE